MRTSKYLQLVAVSILITVCSVFWQMRTSAWNENSSLELTLTPDTLNYRLGEVIGFSFQITNISQDELLIEKPSVHTGTLTLYASSDGENYHEYEGPDWGYLDSVRRKEKIGAGKSFQAKATLLYNITTPTKHLSELYAEKIRQDKIQSEFALETPGKYWLKAVFKSGETRIESEPVAIDVSEPVGVEGVVWEQMKTDGAYALFLQTGEIKYYPGSQREAEFKEKLKQISAEYSSTEAGRHIGERLAKHETSLENLRKLKSEREKMGDR